MILLILHPALGLLENLPPAGHIMSPSGRKLPPSGCLELRSTAALGRQFAALGRHNVWPLGGKFSSIQRAGVQNYYNDIYRGDYECEGTEHEVVDKESGWVKRVAKKRVVGDGGSSNSRSDRRTLRGG